MREQGEILFKKGERFKKRIALVCVNKRPWDSVYLLGLAAHRYRSVCGGGDRGWEADLKEGVEV